MTEAEWHIPERLYHGTTGGAARRAFKEGLQPRRVTLRSNWEVFESRPDYTYLTDAYAPFYADHATTRDGELWGIVEVDVGRLDWHRLRPEEDAMEQTTRGITDWSPIEDPQLRHVLSGMPPSGMTERTAYVQRHADRLKRLWWYTLKNMGTCAYRGAIPSEAVTRISLYDPRSNPFVTLTAIDPTITTDNYAILAGKYRLLTRWFFEPVTAEQWMAEELPGGSEAGGAAVFAKVLGPEKYESLRDARTEQLAMRNGLSIFTRTPTATWHAEASA